jgi:hypothetical protein
MMRAPDIAAHLGLKRYQRSWRGRCPCCDYAAGIFSVREGNGGRALVYCANGCDRAELERATANVTGFELPKGASYAACRSSRSGREEHWNTSDAARLAIRWLQSVRKQRQNELLLDDLVGGS